MLELASKYAALESTIESKAMELDDLDWTMGLGSTCLAGVAAQVREALNAAKGESGSEIDALDVHQEIQEAIEKP